MAIRRAIYASYASVNLGLAAAAYNAGPGRVSAWLVNHRLLPGETRNYVAMVT
jgi:soluble lytic murein transglycosylase-like protein